MAIIYGVDTEKPITPRDVREAIVVCFTKAHQEVLDEMKEFAKDMTPEEFEKIKKINVVLLLRNFFKEVGGDYDNPNKKSILAVLEKLKNFALNFRSPEIVIKHAGEIMQLVNKL